MDIDLSWSHFFKTDAPTLVKDARNEVRKHMDFITSSLSKFDNVSRALSEGHRMLGNVLCKKCLAAVKSKRTEIHSKKKTSHKKKQLMKLSPERQQIVNDISNVFMKFEQPQYEGEEEYCTQEDYYQQEMIEMENMHTNEIIQMQEEMMEIENKYKKEFEDKEVELHDTRKDLQKMTIERDNYKRENASLSVTPKKRYNSSSSGYQSSFVSKNQDAEVARLQGDLISREKELQRSMGDNENLKSEHSKMIEKLQKEICSLKEKLDSSDKDTQKLNTENESLKSKHTELLKQIGKVQEDNCSLQKNLGRTDDELKSVKSQLEVLQKAKRKEIVMGLWKERSGMGKTMVDMISKELMRSVGGQLGRDNITLTIRPCTTTSDISGIPLLVLCLNMSRIGTNIQDAIEGVQADKTNVFVLVLHHTSKDNLSSLTPTSLRVTGSELRKLGGIIDMAFSSDSGVYECDLNNNAAEKITSIMRRYMTA